MRHIIIWFLILSTHLCLSQSNNTVFRHFDTGDLGLKSVRSQYWDSYGHLWFLTEDALVKYDGYQISSVPLKNELFPSDKFLTCTQTDADELWIAYADNNIITRLNIRNLTTKHFHVPAIGPDTASLNPIAKVKKDSRGNIWLVSWGSGLIRLNEKTGAQTVYTLVLPSDTTEIPTYMKDFEELEDGRFLATFFGEGYRERYWPKYFDPETGIFEDLPIAENLSRLADETIRKNISKALSIVHFVHVDTFGGFWFGTYIGMIHMDSKNGTIRRIAEKGEDLKLQNLENTDTYVVHNGKIWATTPNRGIMTVDLRSKEVTYLRHDAKRASSVIDNRIRNLSIDHANNIWCATRAGNISIYAPILQQFSIFNWGDMGLDYTNRSAQTIPVNQMLVRQDGKVYLSHKNGLILYDTDKHISTQIFPQAKPAGSEKDLVLNFKICGDTLYGCQKKDVFALDLKTGKLASRPLTKRYANLLFRHTNKKKPIIFDVVAWGVDQLSEFRYDSDTLIPFLTLPKQVYLSETYSLELPSGNWLISRTNGNFIVIEPETKQVRTYHPNNELFPFPDSVVHIAYIDPDRNVWMGAESGLYLFNEETDKATCYNDSIGFVTGETIRAMIKDLKGRMWLAMERDLVMWDPKTGEVRRFNKHQGLEVGAFLPSIAQTDDNGLLYFATMNGLLRFDPLHLEKPRDVRIDLAAVKIHDTDVSVNDFKRILQGGYRFHWSDNFITFDLKTNQVFTLTPYKFYYRLIGQDDHWIDNGVSNSIRFADLSYGDYTLEVKVVNSYGEESTGLRIPFQVQRPFWLTTWFYILVFVVVTALVLYYIKYRERTLRKRSELLEKKVEQRTSEVMEQKKEAEKQRLEAELQKEIVEEKQKEITDSINYAKRIQEAILPSTEIFRKHLSDSFIFYRPKDIVAGDFYWLELVGTDTDEVIFAAADCTGHGVPGALVSVVCNNALSRSVREFGITDPGPLLDKTRELVIEQFDTARFSNSKEGEPTIRDGMDISLCKLNKRNSVLKWAGANNPLWIIRSGELIEIKPDKQPVGQYEKSTPFATHELQLKKNDMVYIFSDGYADQFGGERGKKFKLSSLRDLFLNIYSEPAEDQIKILRRTLKNWQGPYEQVDDICILGIRI